jgi:hypothetical protein
MGAAESPTGMVPGTVPSGGGGSAVQLPAVVSRRTAYLRSGVDRIQSAADAAVITRTLSDSPQEILVAILTDGSGKVLAVHRHTIGTTAQTQAQPAIIAGLALNAKGATRMYLAHNHPSGTAAFSAEDLKLSDLIANVLGGTSVKYEGMLIVTEKQFNSEWGGSGTYPSVAADIKIPVVERRFLAHGENLPAISGPRELAIYAGENPDVRGIVLVDAQNQVVGVVPEQFFDPIHQGYETIRGPLQEAILREAEKRNAHSFFVISNRALTEPEKINLNKFGNATFMKLIDIFDANGSDSLGQLPSGRTKETMFYSTTRRPSPVALADVQRIFKGQEVIQPGGPSSPVYVKTRGGQYLTIETVNQISGDEVAFEFAYGEKYDPKTMTITGAYNDGVIRLVRSEAGPWTLAHESVHFLEDAGILNSTDVAALKGRIKALVREGKMETANKSDIGGAEDRANFIADQLEKQTDRGFAGRVIARIREWIDRVMEAFGKRTAGAVVRGVQSGRVFEREGLTETAAAGKEYSVTKRPGKGTIPAEETPTPKSRNVAVIRKERYEEKRGETGPFHDVWRIYDENGNRIVGVDYSSEKAAVSKAKTLGLTIAPAATTPRAKGGATDDADYTKAIEEGRFFDAQNIINRRYGIETVSSDIDREGAHSPSDPESGAPAYDLTGNGIYPADVYSSEGLRYYGTGEDQMDAAAYHLIQGLRGRPNAKLTVYRAVEKDAKGGINPGAWVTPIRRYALEHGRAALGGKFKIQSKMVSARDLYTSGDSWLEWGYHPQPNFPRLKVTAEGRLLLPSERRALPNESRPPEQGGQTRPQYSVKRTPDESAAALERLNRMLAEYQANAANPPATPDNQAQTRQDAELNARLDRNPDDQEAARLLFSGNTIPTFFRRFADERGRFRPEEFYRRTGIHLNVSDPKDLIRGVRRIQTMQDLAKNHPIMRELLDAQIEGEGKANQLSIEDRRVMEPYFTLKNKSVARVNAVLFELDAAQHLAGNEELKRRGLSEDEIKGFWAVRKGLDDKMYDVILPGALRDGLSPEAGQHADMTEITAAIRTRTRALSKRDADKGKIDELFQKKIEALRFEYETKTPGGESALQEGKLTEDDINYAQQLAQWAFTMRAYVPHEWEGTWRVKVSLDKPGKQAAIDKARKEAGTDDAAAAKAIEEASKAYTDEYMLEVPTVRGNVALTRKGRQEAAERAAIQIIREKFGFTEQRIGELARDGKVLLVRSTETPVELFEGAREGTMKAIVKTASDKVMREFESEMEPGQRDLMEKMRENVTSTIEEFYLGKGWGRHLIQRKGTLGYREDLRKSLASYLNGVNAYVAKREKAIRFGKTMAKVNPLRTPELWRGGSEYVSDMLGPTTGEARLFKNIVGLYYMAGDLSNAALNMTQNWTHAVALLRGLEPKTDRITADREIARAMKDIAAEYLSAKKEGRELYAEGTKHITPDEAAFLRDSYEKGWLDPAMFGETTGFHRNKIYLDYASELHRKLYFAFTGTEGWNRMSTALAAYRRAIRAEKADAYMEARRIVEGAHFIYGRGNRPEIVRKLGTVGNMAYSFMTYPLNNIAFLKHRFEDLAQARTPEEKRIARKVIGSNLAYIFAFGGLNALPFSWLAKLIWKAFSDPEDDWEKKIYENAPVDVARGITRGIPAVFGNDMSWKVEGTDIFLGPPTGFQAGRSIYRRVWERGIKPVSEGDYWHVLFMAFPDMVMNPYRAYWKEGGTGRAGAPVIEYTPGEKAVAALGFTPTREGETRKAQEIARDKQQEHQEHIRKWADRLNAARRDRDNAAVREIYGEVREFNLEQRKAGRAGLPVLWRDVLEAGKRRKKMKERPYEERAPKYMRGFQREMGQALGITEYGR